ncbi:MAG TPA: hypothetical protein VGO58_06955 [Chitinophagaceae bacterium]|jgi:hypothetical protein|nr:hypothetical protein [Chitinophagaceae bacterium]
MKILSFAAAFIFLVSCSGGSAVSKQLSGSDSLVINFNTPQTNTIAKTTYTTETKAIKKLAHFVDSKDAQAFKCGYDGNLMFYKKGELLGDAAFNYSGDGCHHFIMDIAGKLTPTSMSNEAADFLRSMAEGKGWY